jgi:hypothetical protein
VRGWAAALTGREAGDGPYRLRNEGSRTLAERRAMDAPRSFKAVSRRRCSCGLGRPARFPVGIVRRIACVSLECGRATRLRRPPPEAAPFPPDSVDTGRPIGGALVSPRGSGTRPARKNEPKPRSLTARHRRVVRSPCRNGRSIGNHLQAFTSFSQWLKYGLLTRSRRSKRRVTICALRLGWLF